jgi:hypothetical protein
MNIKIRNKIKYYYECYWRETKNKKVTDSMGNKFPFPTHSNKIWSEKEQFIKKLTGVQNYMKSKNKYSQYTDHQSKNCLLCGERDILNGYFYLKNITWQDDLIHYINVHNIKPSEKFIDIIYKFVPERKKRIINYESEIYTQESIQYLKLDRNQILIIDALMNHGGYAKRYIDANKKDTFKYSEHAGLLDFNSNGLDKIIISGKTSRVDKGDEDIYLPEDMPYALDYEYIFHTHPPTPKPGGRVNNGILFEFPSISDIFHFLQHYNDGKTQGSIVVCAEGLYNIRKQILDNKKINIDENKLYSELDVIMKKSQKDAINTYKNNFTTYEFYSKIAQDRKYIDAINHIINQYKIHIDYFPRIKDSSGKWIIDSIHLPVFITKPII